MIDINQQYIPVLGALGTRFSHKGSSQGSGGPGAIAGNTKKHREVICIVN